MNIDQLTKELRGCSVVIQVDSVSHLLTHNCLLVNDIFLLSYAQAEDIHRRSQVASTMAGRLSNVFERVAGWALQWVYRVCFASQIPVTMEKPDGETK